MWLVQRASLTTMPCRVLSRWHIHVAPRYRRNFLPLERSHGLDNTPRGIGSYQLLGIGKFLSVLAGQSSPAWLCWRAFMRYSREAYQTCYTWLQVVEVYTSIGKMLKTYTAGKLPKAFKIIPSLTNWEQVCMVVNLTLWPYCLSWIIHDRAPKKASTISITCHVTRSTDLTPWRFESHNF